MSNSFKLMIGMKFVLVIVKFTKIPHFACLLQAGAEWR